MGLQLQIRSTRTKIIALCFVILFAAVGSKLLLGSHAASPYISINAASGKLTGPAVVASGAGGQYVQFDNATSSCGTSPAVTLSNPPGPESTAPLLGNCYGLKFNEWNRSEPISMHSDGSPDFKITSSSLSLKTGGAPSGYWELWKGSSWGANTLNKGAPFPYLVSNIKANQVNTSATCNTSGVTGDWDNSYDIWFNADKNAGQTNNQGGTHLEMMVWLNHTPGAEPRPPKVASGVTIGGNTYDIWYDPSGPTVSYVLSSPSNTISFDMLPLIQNATSRGYMQPSWYLLDVEFGFEIWNGGAGLGCSNFAVNAS